MTAVIYTLTGPTGTGKSKLAEMLADEGCPEVVSTTTRAPRPGEQNGVHYHFVSQEMFQEKVARQEFLEHAKYGVDRYGITRDALEKALEKNNTCVAVLEPVGVSNLRRLAPAYRWNVEAIFVRKSRLAILRQLFARHVLKGDLVGFVDRARKSLQEAQWEHSTRWSEVIPVGTLEQMAEHARRLAVFAEHAKDNLVPFHNTRTRPPARPAQLVNEIHVDEVHVVPISEADSNRIAVAVKTGELDPWLVAKAADREPANRSADAEDALAKWEAAGLSTDVAVTYTMFNPLPPTRKTSRRSGTKPLSP